RWATCLFLPSDVRYSMRPTRQDIRYVLRIFGRSPGFAIITILTLALGVGANTAIFNILNALVLRQLPVRQPQQLVEVRAVYRNGAKVPLSFPVFQELERSQRVFSDLFGWTGRFTYNVEADATTLLGSVRAVTGNYYSALGASPLLGRLIESQDVGRERDSQVAVLSYEFWKGRFGGDLHVVGKLVRIEGQPFTIIGVSRRWFTGMTPGEPPEITVPVTAPPFSKNIESRSSLWIFATGRLKDSVTSEQAYAQLHSFWSEVLAATLPTQLPGQRQQSWLAMDLEIRSAANGINADLRAQFLRPLQVLLGITLLVLLIACVNLANLTLARTSARNHEISVRMALGAKQSEIVLWLLTEILLLATSGAALALALAYWGSRFLVHFMTEGAAIPVLLDLRPDWRLLAFAALAAVSTTLLIGLAPAWQTSSQDPAFVLGRGERTVARGTGA